MSETPFKEGAGREPKLHPLKGPNMISTFDCPPRPDAIKVHDAAIRKHLQDRRPAKDPPKE